MRQQNIQILRMPSQQSQPPTENGENDTDSSGMISITRRKALISALAAGIAKSLGIPTSAVSTTDTEIRIELGTDSEGYDQFFDGDVTQFNYDMNNTEVTVDIEEETEVLQEEDQITVTVSIENTDTGETLQLGTAKRLTDTIDTAPSTVYFPDPQDEPPAQNDGWTINNEAEQTPPDSGIIDLLKPKPANYKGIITADELSANPPAPGSTINATNKDKLTKHTKFLIKVKAESENSVLSEQIESTVDFYVSVKFGFGKYFGVNFGTYITNSWGGDWEPWLNTVQEVASNTNGITYTNLNEAVRTMTSPGDLTQDQIDVILDASDTAQNGTVVSAPANYQKVIIEEHDPTNTSRDIPGIFTAIKQSNASLLPLQRIFNGYDDYQ